mgnify:FL=1
MDETRVRRAIFLSDLHLGWVACHELHRGLLDRLPEAVDDAELIVLNGDILDAYRGFVRACDAELVERLARLVEQWRREGRRVVYVEGNHDPPGRGAGLRGMGAAVPEPGLRPQAWRFDFLGADGERVRVLHGHRFADTAEPLGPYEGHGRRLLAVENRLQADHPAVRSAYRGGGGWLVGAVGFCETTLWRRRFPARVAPLLADCDVLIHGHFHFGPGRWRIGGRPVFKSGPLASAGHFGSVDRLLRYDFGRFQRLALGERGFVAVDDDS